MIYDPCNVVISFIKRRTGLSCKLRKILCASFSHRRHYPAVQYSPAKKGALPGSGLFKQRSPATSYS